MKLSYKYNKRPLRFIYIFYWFLLSYILAALIFWFVALNQQNSELAFYRIDILKTSDVTYDNQIKQIEKEKNRKTAQYAGEGITFFMLIIAGAVFVFRIINKQLMQSAQQQNFMMAVTHELKTPIAVTKLNLETMQKRKLEEAQQQKLISSTIQEANRLNALCNNMLLVSQIDTGGYIFTKEIFDLGSLALNCENDFESRFPLRKFSTQIDGSMIVNGDQFLVELAINNLLDNAMKYSGKDSVVMLKVFKEDSDIKLQVIDEGKGIPQAEQPKVFEKFYRGQQRQTKGTGLGLYLTKTIIRQHNGDIVVKNNIPQGCIFEMKFKAA
ncbi:MAG: ATP-binding protein [Ginsengibacter sp.]